MEARRRRKGVRAAIRYAKHEFRLFAWFTSANISTSAESDIPHNNGTTQRRIGPIAQALSSGSERWTPGVIANPLTLIDNPRAISTSAARSAA